MNFVEQIKKNRTFVMGFLVVLFVIYWLKKTGHIEYMLSTEPSQMNAESESMPALLPHGCNLSNMSASVGLLPEANNVVRDEAFEFAPKDMTGVQFMLDTPRFGQDTQGSSNKNASYDIRRTPANEKAVYPWMNSTIEPDLYRRPLD